MNHILSLEKSTFIVMYGRRRLGKSTLLKHVLRKNDIYFLADQTEKRLQIETLAKIIAQNITGFDKVIYPNWSVFFEALNEKTDKKVTLCIDEFPNLVNSSPELPSILQNKLDSKNLKFNLIICGSSQQLMYGLVLNANSPLYGRADSIMKIGPIKLPYMKEALHLSSIESIEEYAVWGGVPRYWEIRENYSNMKETIVNECLSTNGTFYEEPLKLFKDDIKDMVKTSTIMSYIGNGANRLSEIAGRCGEVATNLSRPLNKLILLGYLKKEIPFGEIERNCKKSLYKINDPYIEFHYRYIQPYRSLIEIGRTAPILSEIEKDFTSFVGNHWENRCREAVSGNVLDGITFGMAYRWWGNVSREERIELDVVAESLDKKHLLVGECKWTKEENADRLLKELNEKAKKLPFAKGHKIITKLFLKNKPNDTSDSVLLPDDVIEMLK